MKVLNNKELVEGRYLIEQCVSSGPVRLCQATDQQLERPVTVQLLSEQAAKDPLLAARFRECQQIASTIHNYAVFAVYDVGEWHGRPFSVMEQEAGQRMAALRVGGEGNKPPDVPTALSITRQVAEGLEICRAAGLADWAFSYRAVRVDAEGTARIALIEGLDAEEGSFASNRAATDPQALAALMQTILTGNPDPRATATIVADAPLPNAVVRLLQRMRADGQQEGQEMLRSAGQTARAIAQLESAFNSPTQAYLPADDRVYLGETAGMAEAPTLAAYPPPPDRVEPYIAPPGSRPMFAARGRLLTILPILGVVGALALLLLLAAVIVPRVRQPFVAAGAAQPTQARMVAVPQLLGKNLDDAGNTARADGLNLNRTDAIYNANFAPGTVARQIPDPGGQIQAGGIITVSLSLGPEPTPTSRPAQPVVVPPASQPKPHTPPGREGDDGKDKGKGKDK